jgi:hypothetical protein
MNRFQFPQKWQENLFVALGLFLGPTILVFFWSSVLTFTQNNQFFARDIICAFTCGLIFTWHLSMHWVLRITLLSLYSYIMIFVIEGTGLLIVCAQGNCI